MSFRALALSVLLTGVLVSQAPVSVASVPEDSVTYTLQPLNYNVEDSVAAALGGSLCSRGQCVNIRHPAAFGDASIQAGTDNLDATLRGDRYTSVTVAGQSQGAQSVTRWLDEHGGSLAPEEVVTFILIANPSRKTGFQSQNRFTSPTTEESRYTVIDVAREYDGWAHWPDRFNVLAVVNATMGMFTIHNTYEDVNGAPTTVEEIQRTVLDDPHGDRNLVWKSGNTYYVLNRTEVLPIAVPLTWVGMHTAAKNLSDALRPTIDAAYNNPEQGQGMSISEAISEDAPKSVRTSRAADAPLGVRTDRDAETRPLGTGDMGGSGAGVSAPDVPSTKDARAERQVEGAELTIQRDSRVADRERKRAERGARAEASKSDRESDLVAGKVDVSERDTPRMDRAESKPSHVQNAKAEDASSDDRSDSRDGTDNGADE